MNKPYSTPMAYPFAALVGQTSLKQALLLCAVNPGLGGVLLRGDKGTAKTTAVRGLSAVMPAIERVAGSRFNCRPDEPLAVCEACQQPDFAVETVPVPFVDLPLGATEDRVLGSLDLEGVLLERKKKLQPGLLATAHRGILYIDEVNLLPDHLVDGLLDVAAMGVNTIQRDGLAVSHPARFTLIGTMNPEEGQLRPQFLDRFGLVVDVTAPQDVAERTEVVRRRIAFETDPTAFASRWAAHQAALQTQVQTARELLPSVTLPDGLLTLIGQLCTELNVISLRADIVIYKTALTLAALAGRTGVTPADIRRAAELALPHRQRKKPTGQPPPDSRLDEVLGQPPPHQLAGRPNENQGESPTPPPAADAAADGDSPPADESPTEQIFGARPVAIPPTLTAETTPSRPPAAPPGRRAPALQAQRGAVVGAVPSPAPTDLSIPATLQTALLRDADDGGIIRADLRQNVRRGKTGNLILFVVDASGSMAAGRRMEAVKGSVLSLLTSAYQHRDSVGLLVFRGVEAQLLLEPTRSIERAEEALLNLPTGGRTPLPHALQLALQVVQPWLRPDALRPFLVILSDGKANVSLPGGGDAWQQTLTIAAQLRDQRIPALVLDTDADYLRLGRAAELAAALGADCLSLDELSAETLTQTVTGRLTAFA